MDTVEIIISLIVGVASGILSAVIVSHYYNNKEAEATFHKELHEDKQNTVKFLQDVQLELKLIQESINRKEEPYLKDIRRVLSNYPRTPSFASESLTEVSVSRIFIKNDVVEKVEKYVATGEFDEKTLILLDREILNAQVEILQIETKKN